jgi:hypothetical protein
MFKSVLATGIALLLLTLCLAPVSAQSGYIAASPASSTSPP